MHDSLAESTVCGVHIAYVLEPEECIETRLTSSGVHALASEPQQQGAGQ